MVVLDISTPAAPMLVGSFDTAGNAYSSHCPTARWCLRTSEAGLAVFDDCRDVVFGDGFEALGLSGWSAVQP